MPIDADEFSFGEEVTLEQIWEDRKREQRKQGIYFGDDTVAAVYIKKSVLRRLERHKGLQSWTSFMSLVADMLDLYMRGLSLMVLAHDDLKEKLFGEDKTDMSKVKFEKDLLKKGVSK